jgi:hypothetical protein
MEKRIKYGIALLLLLMAGLAIYGYLHHLPGGSPLPLKEADISIAARDLVSVFDKNETLSDRKYVYKVLSVRGVIKKIRKNEDGNYIIYLGSNPEPGPSVSCSLDSLYNSHSLSLKAGDSATIRGTCAGRLTDVVLIQCIIEK